jgi:hypothetical protein
MIAAGLTIALVDPNLDQVVSAGVVFRALAGRDVVVETGVIYRRGDTSPILLSFLDEVRATPPEHAAREAATPRKPASGKRVTQRNKGASRAARPRVAKIRRKR